MAITKTIFTGTTAAANGAEVLAFLQANAADYFDTITSPSNGMIKCLVGTTEALVLGTGSDQINGQIKLANGAYKTIIFIDSVFVRGYATSNGLLLIQQTVSYGTVSLFITKNSQGNACVVSMLKENERKPYKYVSADIVNGAAITQWSSTNTMSEACDVLSKSAAATGLCPFVFDSGDYTPGLFVATFSQYVGTECEFSLNGVEYVTDGAIALKDG